MSEPTDAVIVNVDKMLNDLHSISPQSNPKIFKVDDHLRRVNENAYDPVIVSVGPIHRHKKHVKDMEQHKMMYLQQFLRRNKESSVKRYVMELRNLEEEARQYYTKSTQLDHDKFVEMLLIDGFFIIELLRKVKLHNLRDKNDYIFQSYQMGGLIRHDLLLFENQLPFFILNKLFEMTKMKDSDYNLRTLIFYFVGDMFPWMNAEKIDSRFPLDKVDHLLGLVYKSCYSSKNIPHNNSDKVNNINSVSGLKEAGIQLKKAIGGTLLDLTFDHGVLELPKLNITDKTESLLRNMIAYEQFLPIDHYPKYVTDYVFFMHCLINSEKDAEILRRSGIISNCLGDDDTVYRMFNSLGTNVVMSSKFYYSDIFKHVNKHCCLRHKIWMANLTQKYFNSPWAFMSFSGAVMLLLLTLTQTVFSILSYTHQKSN